MMLDTFASLLSWASTKLDIEFDQNSTKEMLSYFSDDIVCLVPCFLLRSAPDTQREAMSSRSSHASNSLTTIINTAKKLAAVLICRNTEILDIPSTILINISTSFMDLVNSRMNNVKRAFAKQSSTYQSKNEILIALNDLSTQVEICTIVTSFRALSQTQSESILSNDYVSLPLLFEVTMDLTFFGEKNSAVFTAPGTITGSFRETTNKGIQARTTLRSVEIHVEMNILLKSMMTEARRVAKKVIGAAINQGSIGMQGRSLSSIPSLIGSSRGLKTVDEASPSNVSCRNEEYITSTNELTGGVVKKEIETDINNRSIGMVDRAGAILPSPIKLQINCDNDKYNTTNEIIRNDYHDMPPPPPRPRSKNLTRTVTTIDDQDTIDAANGLALLYKPPI
mmetsp:Transcript_31751/g.36460  ORF Transcript_31751/g.36460 Transcript_31751/m.36460 type:complete len:395 (+) Transcript_31751:139-1323(+)